MTPAAVVESVAETTPPGAAASPSPAPSHAAASSAAAARHASPTIPRSAQLAGIVVLATGLAVLSSQAILDGRLSSRSAPPYQALLDLNRASRAELTLLPGIGPGLADRIEAERSVRPFHSVDDLVRVPGIGKRTLERLRDRVFVALPQSPDRGDPATAAPKASVTTAAARAITPVNPNTATREQLDALPGIGLVLSQRIVDARAQRPFAEAADLRRVKGIGPKTLERIKPFLTFAAP